MGKDTTATLKVKISIGQKKLRTKQQIIRRRDATIVGLRKSFYDVLEQKNAALRRIQELEDLLLQHTFSVQPGPSQAPEEEKKAPEPSASSISLAKDAKPYGYKYSAQVIAHAVELQTTDGLSYRQVRGSLRTFLASIAPKSKLPSHTTIWYWVHKCGLYELSKQRIEIQLPLVIGDETASIGWEKGFITLAVSVEAWRKKRKALTFEDVTVLSVSTKKSWTGEQIQDALKVAVARLTETPIGLLSDCCSSMTKAARGFLLHLADCTHKMANCIERYYKNHESFKLLMSEIGKFRQKTVNSQYVEFISPNLRTKSRFLNLFTVTDWIERIRRIWDSLDEVLKKKLSFLTTHAEFSTELCQMIKLVEALSKLLKIKGVDETTRQQVVDIFNNATVSTETTKRFKEDMLAYVDQIRSRFPLEDSLPVCSDIIETIIGKLKSRCQKICNQGIGKDLLSLPLFGKKITPAMVMEAMESVKKSDIEVWASENLVETFGQAKRRFNEKTASPKTDSATK
jgi:hypothetical protein